MWQYWQPFGTTRYCYASADIWRSKPSRDYVPVPPPPPLTPGLHSKAIGMCNSSLPSPSTKKNTSGCNFWGETSPLCVKNIIKLSKNSSQNTTSGLMFNPLNAELNPICYLLVLLAHHFLHVSRIRVKSLTLRLLMSYIYIYIYTHTHTWSTYSWCF